MLAAGAAVCASTLNFLLEADGRVEIAFAQGGAPDPLFEAILSRQCTRSDYDGHAVPSADLAALKAAARVEGAEVTLIIDPVRIAQVLDLILAANAA